MKWEVKDIEKYLQEKEYIDSVIIPLIPFSWNEQLVSSVREGQYINTLSIEVEHQLRGRVVEIPPFTYLRNESIEQRLQKLKNWDSELRRNGIKFIFYLTSDADWKQVDSLLDSLLWMPAVPLEHMENKYRNKFIDEGVSDLLGQITQRWQAQIQN
ncbi:YpiF family protein [Scopulibacillus cellulosilyticus]|uniref:YpiF family protein n=1 Tax=Scopulibacillus cellulosilyticus TaxID=2665665 RepID=A0ABW2PTM1_9BACL